MPLVVEPGDPRLVVVAAVVVAAGQVVRVVWGAVLLLDPAVVVLDDPVHVGLRPGAVTSCSDPGSPETSSSLVPRNSGPHLLVVVEHVVVGTVHHVLLGQVVLHDAGGEPHAALEGGDGGKSGAAPAALLVLDGGDSALLHPAPLGGGIAGPDPPLHHLVDGVGHHVLGQGGHPEVHVLGKLLRGEVGPLGDLLPPGDLALLLQLVVCEHVIVVPQEGLPPLVVLLDTPVVLVEVLGELQEVRLGGQGGSNQAEYGE